MPNENPIAAPLTPNTEDNGDALTSTMPHQCEARDAAEQTGLADKPQAMVEAQERPTVQSSPTSANTPSIQPLGVPARTTKQPEDDGVQTYLKALDVQLTRLDGMFLEEKAERVANSRRNAHEIWDSETKIAELFSEALADMTALPPHLGSYWIDRLTKLQPGHEEYAEAALCMLLDEAHGNDEDHERWLSKLVPMSEQHPKQIAGALRDWNALKKRLMHAASAPAETQTAELRQGLGVSIPSQSGAGVLTVAQSTDNDSAEQFVTLDQMASIVGKSKKTLERALNKKNSDMPRPDVKGGGGEAHEWIWSKIRRWLEKKYNRHLPALFPTIKCPSANRH